MGNLPSVCAASIVPVTSEGDVDQKKLRGHCQWILANGCDGVVLFGTTGEAASFGIVERKETLESLVSSGVAAGKLIVGTGCCSVADTAILSLHALGLGCAGVLVHPPYFFRPATDDGVFRFYVDLIDTLGDAARDVIFYHFPEATGAPVNPEVIAQLMERFPDVFVGIKDSTGSLENMVNLTRRFAALRVFSGDDDLLWPLLDAGGYGAITATANLAPNLLAQVKAGWPVNTADVQQARGVLDALWSDILLKFPISEAIKEIIANVSGDDGWRAVRPPLSTLPDVRRQQLLEMVAPFAPHLTANLGRGIQE